MKASRVSGFSILSVVAALALVGILYVGLNSLNQLSADVDKDLVAVPKGSRKTVCLMNRQTISRQLMTWNVTHPGQTATIKTLRNSGVNIPACPEGGKFSIQGQSILCSEHPE